MRIRSGRLATIGIALTLLVSACSGGGAGGSSAPKGTVNIAVNPWVGYTADAAVVAYILENKMGYDVNLKDLKEDVSWQGFDSGEVDVILENWGHPDLEKTYIEDKKVAMDAGQTGNVGIIGWYVPKWYADANPDVVSDFMNLNNHVADFKTVESGDKGQFLGTDPSYVQYDEALIKNFGLNFTVKFSGSENATIEAIKTAVNQKKPLLFYWWDPQWVNSQVELTRIPLPKYTEGCDADKEKVACDYPETPLNKIMRVKFNQDGGAAAQFIKNFNWTNADQNEVAAYITNDNMKPEDAAKKWVDAHESVWKAWIPS
ncbi:MAG TPA: ABC transporter substrate-binding protein [Candidatus Limnocylindrales bacterium]|nr:ABC transporter substrate-binding protein [Candidatus Limnocylindrales bacterium]